MITLTCDNCNYTTTDKSNFRRHLKTSVHKKKISLQNYNIHPTQSTQNTQATSEISVIEHKSNIHKCKCGKIFLHHSSLSRHKIKCAYIEKDNEVVELKGQVASMNNKLDNMNKMIYELVKSNKNQKMSTSNHYNISVKTYIQQNYPDAPMIEEPSSYAKLNYENQELIDTLIYKYKHKCLHEYLGDFLVEYYKKDDPSNQSIWSSDISRLTYLIKEALVDKKSIWNHDYKGVKTKKYIVEPLLQYVKKYIASYWEKNLNKPTNKKKEVDVDALAKRQADYNITYAIESDIDNGIMANDIIKYIASHFRMDKHTANITFIDHDQEDDE